MSRGDSRGNHSLEPTGQVTRLHRLLHPQNRRGLRPVALVTAPVVTALAVGVGMLTTGSSQPDAPTARSSSASIGDAANAPQADAVAEPRTLGTSRSTQRVPLVDRRVPRATGRLWTTADLKLRVEPRERSRVVGILAEDKRVPVTGKKRAGYAEVITGRVTRWVTAEHLSRTKEVEPRVSRSTGSTRSPGSSDSSGSTGTSGLVDQPCAATASVESGLTSDAVRVYRAVCNNFPQITTYGGLDAHGEHTTGRALDIMTSDSALGTQIAEFLRANASALNLFDVIWAQRIWTPQRAGEGWRSMEDRGSSTANHYDHVHVSVN